MPLGATIVSTQQPQAIASIRVYPGADADFTLFSDDGTTYAYEKNAGSVTKLHWDEAAHQLKHEGAPAWNGQDSEVVDVVHP